MTTDFNEGGTSKIPSVTQAQRDLREFESIIANVIKRSDLRTLDPKAQKLVSSAEIWVNHILQDAGNVPHGDPRHEVFDAYNQILEKWRNLYQLP